MRPMQGCPLVAVPSRLSHGQGSSPQIEEVDTLIVSDVHLGTELSRSTALLATLQRSTFRRLILLGDILDDVNFGRLSRPHWDLLAYIRSLSAGERHIEVVWVAGNHDHLLSRLTYNFLGLRVHSRYQWHYEGKTFLAMHGHQFDAFIARHPLITETASLLYGTLQRWEKDHHRLSRFLKRTSKTWLQVSELVAQKAAAYAAQRGANGIFCGHTHIPLSRRFGDVTYHNTGCWTEKPATFITLGARGIQLQECP
ncbi:MAG: UDP-2,3-diacylglucosamine diphosphatase [Candidatus Binatia bacterium]